MVLSILIIPRVSAITSEEVLYDKNGEEKVLKETLDELYTELNICYTKGDATSNDIVSGKSAYVKGKLVNGSMPQRPSTGNVAQNKAWLYNNSVYFGIESGYYPSSSYGSMTGVSERYITNDSLASTIGLTGNKIAYGQSILGIGGTYTSDATASANQMLSGVTAYVKGNKITGTIGSKGAATYTPGTVNQTISAGQYLSGAQTIKGDGNLTAGNIKSGVSIFGVSGTFTSDATATSGDIASGKTAYVKGQKVTGTGGNWKVFNLEDDPSAVKISGWWDKKGLLVTEKPDKFKTGSWVSIADVGSTTSFTIDLGFIPTEVAFCDIQLFGEMMDNGGNPFRRGKGYAQYSTTTQYYYMYSLQSGEKVDNSSGTAENWSYYEYSCSVSGSKLSFKVENGRTSSSQSGIKTYTRASQFYLRGKIVYK